MKYNTKIAINGQIDNDYKIGFTYPKPFDPARFSSEDEWLKSLTDPRIARPFNSDKIFVYWKNEFGNYYSLIIPNTLDARDGKLMLTIFTGEHIVSSGKMVIEVLSKLSDGLVPNLKYLASWQANPEILNRIDILLSDLESSYSDDNYTSLNQTKNNIAYRAYSSQEELEEIIQFPNQVEYENYKKILIVPQPSVPAQLPAGYEEVKSKIKKTYRISGTIPSGVSIDGRKLAFVEGDTIKLIYSKEGYVSQPIKFKIDGSPNDYVRYEGTTIHLKSSEEIGVTFKRGLYLQFRSNKGNNVSSVSIKYNGQKREHKNGDLFVFDDDRNVYDLVISAYGYSDSNITISKEEILASNVKTVTLDPEEKKLKISLETDKGRKEGYVSVKVDDPLYDYLQEASKTQNTLIFKKKDNYSREKGSDKQPSKHGFLESIWDPEIFISVLKILGGLLIIYFLYCAYVLSETNNSPWPFGNDKKETIETPFDPQEYGNDGNNDQDNLNPEQEDIYYLKKENTWIKDSIKTNKYKDLYDFISKGEIENILNKDNNDWFPSELNGYWKQCYQILRAISDKKDKIIFSKASEEMKRLSQNDSIQLKELKDALHSVDNPPSGSENREGKGGDSKPSGNSNTTDKKRKNGEVPSSNGGRESSH